MSCYLITGGAGFIGSELARQLAASGADKIIILDKLTYAGHLSTIHDLLETGRTHFAHGDVADPVLVAQLLAEHEPDAIAHLAAESHVDRSIDHADPFIHTNIVGTQNLLDRALDYWRTLPAERQEKFRFLHVSTDEVFGEIGGTGKFDETSPYAPRSPYAASKAAADHLVRAWYHTYGLPVMISNCSNNYGPYQLPEKLLPLMILNAFAGKNLPVYGKGEQVRDWLHVSDHASALQTLLKLGQPGETYLIGARNEWRNIDLVEKLCELLDSHPATLKADSSYKKLITFVPDRPGHDARYAVNPKKIEQLLGWQPEISFAQGLNQMIGWYHDNENWWRPLQELAQKRQGKLPK